METKITLEELGNILADTALAMVTPVRVTKDTPREYYKHLSEYPAGLVRAACEYHLESDEGTFFPSISHILKNVREILRLSMGIPSPMEAWGMIQDSARYKHPEWCPIGVDIRKGIDGKIGGEYLKACLRLAEHEKSCEVCHNGFDFDDFGHPAITETIRRLGGKSYVITGSPTADRARWIEAYSGVLDKEFRMITTSPSVRGYIESISVQPAGVLEAKMSSLAMRLSAPTRKVSNGLPERMAPASVPAEDMNQTDEAQILKQEKAYAYETGE